MYEFPQDVSGFSLERAMRFTETNTQALSKLNGSMFNAWAGCSREVFELINKRAQAYTSLPGALAACSTAQDLVELQGQFVETMVQNYQGHISNMSNLCMALWAVPADTEEVVEPEKPKRALTRKVAAPIGKAA